MDRGAVGGFRVYKKILSHIWHVCIFDEPFGPPTWGGTGLFTKCFFLFPPHKENFFLNIDRIGNVCRKITFVTQRCQKSLNMSQSIWNFIIDDQKYISHKNRSHKASIYHHINIYTLLHITESESEDKGKKININFSTRNLYLFTLLPTSTYTPSYLLTDTHIRTHIMIYL